MRSLALALPALVTAYVAYAPADGPGAFVNGALQNILKNTDKTDKYRYPTDFTRDIEPVSRWPSFLLAATYATAETVPQPQ